MARIKEAFVRDVLGQHLREEISFSRFVELLNEEASRKVVIGIATTGSERGQKLLEAFKNIAEMRDIEVCIVEQKADPIIVELPPITDIKLSDADVPLCPKHENQPWSKGYRNELNRYKGKRKK